MFCTNCGNNLPDGTKFCTKCGAPIVKSETVTEPMPAPATPPAVEQTMPVTEQPTPVAEQPIPTSPIDDSAQYAPDNKSDFSQVTSDTLDLNTINAGRDNVKKYQYVKEYAPKGIKNTNVARIVVSIVCVLALLFSLAYSFCIDIIDIPLVSWAVSSTGTGYELETMLVELENMGEALEEERDSISDSDKTEFEAMYGIDADTYIDDSIDVAKSPSLFNFTKFLTRYKIFLIKENSISSSDADIFLTAIYVLIALFAIGFIFAMFGVIFKKQGLIITGHILSVLYAIIFGGPIPAVLILASFLTLSILISKINKSYNAFKRGLV